VPVYAYACTACGHAFDARQGFDEPALTVCDACGGALRKQYGTVGVTFNGSGFYRTDSRSAGNGGAGGAASATSSSSGTKPAATSSATSGGGASA